MQQIIILTKLYALLLRVPQTFSQNRSHYYEQPDFDYVHILRTMDIMKEHYEEYISHLYEKS